MLDAIAWDLRLFFSPPEGRSMEREYAGFIGLRVRPSERQALETLAEQAHTSLSELIRRMITKEAVRTLAEASHAETVHDD
jgi:hypothetical protein